MKDPDLDRLFERFRRQGDVEAMGAIFDATAAELSRVAGAWARTADEVEVARTSLAEVVAEVQHALEGVDVGVEDRMEGAGGRHGGASYGVARLPT